MKSMNFLAIANSNVCGCVLDAWISKGVVAYGNDTLTASNCATASMCEVRTTTARASTTTTTVTPTAPELLHSTNSFEANSTSTSFSTTTPWTPVPPRWPTASPTAWCDTSAGLTTASSARRAAS
ncbi:hypothetical protein ABL78_2270 [Leptomonas seymouri]|uniref:Uncharacterized protein n=1 Tax=Leptomonas seymouri TaxID=5684 RepID=A0A0N1I7R3_LEPSE|nr:hypothetical protein ABL78_2270 [Leptomonas seymouri]|eukprot:KPI88602.1 hypothetical protein ABL78_2270 [Leptomonas seymouri]